MDPQEQESQVVEFKKVGNSYFAKKKYKEAVGAYSDALDLFRSLSLEEVEGVTEPILLSNRAAALIALKKGKESLEDATLCVSLSPKWVKGHIRMADSYVILEEWSNALSHYSKGLEIEPKNQFCQKGIEKCRNGIKTQTIMPYYKPFLDNLTEQGYNSLEIRYLNDQLGKGLFTKTKISQGNRIFFELPLVSRQMPESKKKHPLCSHCGCFVGSPKEQVTRLLTGTQEKYQELPNTSPYYPPSPSPLSCDGCEEVYCGSVCKKKAHHDYQQYFCGLKGKKEKAWKEFIEVAQGCSERLIMGAKLIAMIIQKTVHNYNDLCSCGAPTSSPSFSLNNDRDRCVIALQNGSQMIRNVTKHPWTSLLSNQLKPGGESGGEGEGREYLMKLMQIKEVERSMEKCVTLLREVFPEGVVEKWGEVFENKYMDHLIGMFQMNNCTYRVLHPLQQYITNLRNAPKDIQPKLRARLQPLLIALNQHYGGDISAEGEGFFTLHSCMNHSCVPNAHQQSPSPSPPQPHKVARATSVGIKAGVEIVASKDIGAGEEIKISYTPQSLSQEERREELKTTYMFDCVCEGCCKKKTK